MRFAAAALALLILAGLPGPAAIQPAASQPAASQPAATSGEPGDPVAAAYAAMTEQERMAIQEDLIWTGDYAGGVDGDFGARSQAAARSFQKRIKVRETAIIAGSERERLKLQAQQRRTAVGWRLVDDPATGVRLGIPGKLMPQQTKVAGGTRWSSPRGEAQVEAFRIAGPGTTLQGVHDAQISTAHRKVTYTLLRPDFFVVSGTQGTRKVYVRAQGRDGQVRGFSIAYDQGMAASLDPVVIAMSAAFRGFPDAAPAVAGPPPRRKVEYGSGVIVSPAGHVATTQDLIEGCHQFTVAGHGPAELVAADKEAGAALLRLYGATGLQPAALASAVGSAEMQLVGVADPSRQQGGGEVSVTAARMVAAEAGKRPGIDPAPGLGFAGAAVTSSDGALVGLVDLRLQMLAGASSPGAFATLVPASSLRMMLEKHGATAVASAPAGASATQAAVVRVICLRK